MEKKEPISNVSQEKLVKAMQSISRIEYRYVYLQAGLYLTSLSMNGVFELVVGPRMRNFHITTAQKLVDF